ncbi:apoptosis-inducing factor 3-like isoform X2 [Planococcus citri]|uniref:apoptosis-inducing factor 3-like isoform X2 n=1 Tax=Planococcus citri TaxID=170843 RepID=UPI0031F9A80C
MLKLFASCNLLSTQRIFRNLGITAVRTVANGQETIEAVVCKDSDVPDNGMKEFPFGPDGDKILLVKQQGKLYGLGTKCSHYGVPLVNGALGKGRIRCPAHGACFNVSTGDIEEAPGLDGIPCFQVQTLANGDVVVCAAKSALKTPKKVKPMVRKSCNLKQTYVVVGAGAAGSSCAEVLRQEGFKGRIVVIGEEKHLPYDRVKSNKAMDMDVNKIILREKEFYDSNDIEMMNGERVTKLDTNSKIVSTDSGKEFPYDKVFIGVGVKPRRPTFIPNHELENIFTIRNIDDGNLVDSKLGPLVKVVIIGSSFIAMESAAYCAPKVARVTVIGRSSVPFSDTLGEEVGDRFKRYFESRGVSYRNNSNVVRFEGENDKLTQVVLNTGEVIPADICIVGIGSEYDTGFLKDTGVTLTKNGAIEVNEYLQTNLDGVFAGGDTCNAPVHGSKNVKASIGHWQLAQHHGRIAALNMLGKQEPIRSVPFFFSAMFSFNLRYSGYGHGFTEAITVGDLENFKFVTYYLKDDEVIAATSIGADPIVAKVAEVLHSGKKIVKEGVHKNQWLSKYDSKVFS